MLEVVLSNRFKKDLKLAVRRGLPLDELNTVVDWLAAGQALPDRNRDHALTGDYIGFRECHIRPDCARSFTVWTAMLLSFSCSVPVRIRICLIRIFPAVHLPCNLRPASTTKARPKRPMYIIQN